MSEILHNILKSNTGCHRRDVTVENVLRDTEIGEKISVIQKNFGIFSFKKVERMLNEKVKEDFRGQKMSHQEILCLLKASPYCIDKQAVDDEIEVSVRECGIHVMGKQSLCVYVCSYLVLSYFLLLFNVVVCVMVY